jgi:polyhydroxyalkanoate synthase
VSDDRATTHDTPLRDLSAPLDGLLVDAAALTSLHRWLPSGETVAFANALARQPRAVTRTVVSAVAELTRVAAGTSTCEPSSRDRRFADDGWRNNPLLRRSVQAYLASSVAVQRLIDVAGLEGRDDQRLRFLVDNLLDALAPSNVPLLNPAALKEAVDTGGGSLVRGLGNLADDLRQAPRVPNMVDKNQLAVGEHLAATPGAVVFRAPLFELIQYTPTTEAVRATPVLLVPPTINKFYVLDLAPGRSLVQHLVDSGQQVFVLSWRNPSARHADWGLDTYVLAVTDALDAMRDITRSDQAHLFGACSGGVIASMAAAYLSGVGRQDELTGLTLAVSVLDQADTGTAGSLIDESRAKAAIARSARVGYLDGRSLAEVFAWLRPNDLIWNYWVNNYLLGKNPPAFDILAWNVDQTNLPASLHRQFLQIFSDNALATPNVLDILGTPVDLGRIAVESYVTGATTDHLTPWRGCFRTTELLQGDSTFILSNAGHIASLINPPGNPKAHFFAGPEPNGDPDAWRAKAERHQGTWWEHWAEWITARSGEERRPARSLGSKRHPVIEPAPGSYVRNLSPVAA